MANRGLKEGPRSQKERKRSPNGANKIFQNEDPKWQTAMEKRVQKITVFDIAPELDFHPFWSQNGRKIKPSQHQNFIQNGQ